MSASKLKSLQDVVEWGLCIGCGACYSACRKGGVTLVDIETEGIRPRFDEDCGSCSSCLSFCPGALVDGHQTPEAHRARHSGTNNGLQIDEDVGPYLEIWEGYAADPEVRYQASSGGLLTALSLFALESEGFEKVLHSGMNPDKPWTNQTFESRRRDEIMARTGSRYATSSPCDGLRAIEQSTGPALFIGKPCDASAVQQMRKDRPDLDRRLGLVLSFFCAGTPSTAGTQNLIQLLGMDNEPIREIRYRGEGWPGRFRVRTENGQPEKSLSYRESWGRLTGYRPLRCNLCPDGLGRLADISCGDAWDQFEEHQEDPGRSVVVVRTERGREFLRRAREAGVVILKPADRTQILQGQPSLLGRRRALYGRLLAFRLLGVPVPSFPGFSLRESWMRLPVKEKLRTVLGTMRRIILRGWYRRRGS